jgi:peptidoglycan/LPS O-acetylase OafA/YrhL
MEIERRNKWIGIIIGACFVAASFIIIFYFTNLYPFYIVSPLIGGFLAGMLSSGNVKDGIKSGAMSGFLGSVILAVPFMMILGIALMEGSAGFVAGMGILFGLVFTALAVLFASAGGGVGAICKKAVLGNRKQDRQEPDQPSG